MLGMPSWVISITHTGSLRVVLGPSPPATPLSQGTVSPRSQTGTGACREVASSVFDEVPDTGSQSEGTSQDAGTTSALAASKRHQWGIGHAHQNCSFTPVWWLWLKVSSQLGTLRAPVPVLRQCGTPCHRCCKGYTSSRGRRGWWLRWHSTCHPRLVCHAMLHLLAP